MKPIEEAPSKEEVSDLVNNLMDYKVPGKYIEVVRRLAFDWKRLKYRLNHQTADDVEACKRGLHGDDCGK